MCKKIFKLIDNNNYLRRTFFGQLTKRWLNRLIYFKTIYKKSKLKAIRNYIINDFEHYKMMTEIDGFRTGNLYNFNGIKLPLSIITADTYLNVLKPHVENIKYTPESIEDFYLKQKNNYKTISYHRDTYLGAEPDYKGGHIYSHGFTYFYKEICISLGDVVIDLGAAPGDFSALCIKMGASKIYSFDPDENEGSDLLKVNSLNENKIQVVKKYCSSKSIAAENIISLDDFIEVNNIKKIDFIKSDIEGFETKALEGAKNILKIFKPKLAFCSYHSVSDEDLIEKIILDSNPEYKIYKKRGIIYAY